MKVKQDATVPSLFLAEFTVYNQQITGGNMKSWVMMWERTFPGVDVGFPEPENQRLGNWSSHWLAIAKVISTTAFEVDPLPGKIMMLGKPDFDEKQNQETLGLDSHMALGS